MDRINLLQDFRKAVGCVNKNSTDNYYLEPVVNKNQKNNGCKSNQDKKKFSFLSISRKSKKLNEIIKIDSIDSSFFSDPEAHDYEEIDDEKLYAADDEVLINFEKNTNGSKNNLYFDVCSSEQINSRSTKFNSKESSTKKNPRYNRLREYFQKVKPTQASKNDDDDESLEIPDEFSKKYSKQIKKEEKSLLLVDDDNDDDDDDIDDEHSYSCLEDESQNIIKQNLLYDTFNNLNVKKNKFCYNKLNEFKCKENLNDKKPSTSILDRLQLKRKNIENSIQQQQQTKQEADELAKKTKKLTCLTEIKPTSLFNNHLDGIVWYYNLLYDTMLYNIKDCKQFKIEEIKERIIEADRHLLYVKNLYEVRIVLSKQLKQIISTIHPCIVALALFLDSDTVKIYDTHIGCTSDNYVYLFSTKIKFCAWKVKFYIALKKPRNSSFDRLKLIENVINCHKLIQDKSIF